MVKVYNWKINKVPPEDANINDLQFGIGYMNDILLQLADRMSDLIRRTGATDRYDVSRTIRNFDRFTLSKQIGILRERYYGVEISSDRFMQALEKRDYFINRFNSGKGNDLSSDAKKLMDVINTIREMNGSLSNVSQKVYRKPIEMGIEDNTALRKKMLSLIADCDQYVPGRVDLDRLAQKATDAGIRYQRPFYKFLESLDIKTDTDPEKGNRARYVSVPPSKNPAKE